VLALVAAAGAIPMAVILVFGHSMLMVSMKLHFAVVGLEGLVGLGAALALTAVAVRRSDARTVVFGIAFATMTAMLIAHALASPTVLIGGNGLVQLAGAGNVPAGAVILALAAIPSLGRPEHIRRLLIFGGIVLAAVATVATVGLLDPAAIPQLPGPGGSLAEVVLVAGLLLLGLLAYRAARTFLLTRRTGDVAIVLGLVWLGCAQVGLLLYTGMDFAFWFAHLLEAAGLVFVGVPVALDLKHRSQSYALAGDLKAAELVSQEEEYLGPRVRGLMERLADKDAYLERHTRAVALLAVQVGEQLGLSATRLRALAIGGLLHDIGKLSLPDRILQKPGPLTDEEFAVIRLHPVNGDALIVQLGGFPAAVRRLVLNHHERLDGNGYPNKLGEQQLDLETRILTVCDVFDALTSKRVYRDAWSQDRALALLHEESGSAFDPSCVTALETILAVPAPASATAVTRRHLVVV
jgi:HD-GYP domain-containing protein (c-di-GMP phosphodiesterase class II)